MVKNKREKGGGGEWWEETRLRNEKNNSKLEQLAKFGRLQWQGPVNLISGQSSRVWSLWSSTCRGGGSRSLGDILTADTSTYHTTATTI